MKELTTNGYIYENGTIKHRGAYVALDESTGCLHVENAHYGADEWEYCKKQDETIIITGTPFEICL